MKVVDFVQDDPVKMYLDWCNRTELQPGKIKVPASKLYKAFLFYAERYALPNVPSFGAWMVIAKKRLPYSTKSSPEDVVFFCNLSAGGVRASTPQRITSLAARDYQNVRARVLADHDYWSKLTAGQRRWLTAFDQEYYDHFFPSKELPILEDRKQALNHNCVARDLYLHRYISRNIEYIGTDHETYDTDQSIFDHSADYNLG